MLDFIMILVNAIGVFLFLIGLYVVSKIVYETMGDYYGIGYLNSTPKMQKWHRFKTLLARNIKYHL